MPGRSTSSAADAALDPQVKTASKSQLPALFNIIDDVTATRGASTLLVQYWTDVQNFRLDPGMQHHRHPQHPATTSSSRKPIFRHRRICAMPFS